MILENHLLVLWIRLECYKLLNIAKLNLNDTIVIRDVFKLRTDYFAHHGASGERIVCLSSIILSELQGKQHDNATVSRLFTDTFGVFCYYCFCGESCTTHHGKLVNAVLNHESLDKRCMSLRHVLSVLLLIQTLFAICKDGQAEHLIVSAFAVLHGIMDLYELWKILG